MSADLRFEGEDGVTVLVVPDRDEFGDPKSVAHVLDHATALRLHTELAASLHMATVCEICRGDESLEGFPEAECPSCKGRGQAFDQSPEAEALAKADWESEPGVGTWAEQSAYTKQEWIKQAERWARAFTLLAAQPAKAAR